MALVVRPISETRVTAGEAAKYVLGNGCALLVGLLSTYGAIWLSGQLQLKGWDFFLYYAVSHLVVTGDGASMYSLSAVGHMEHALAPHYVIPGGSIQNVYSPLFVVALAPLAALPYVPAYFIWLGINCLSLAACLYVAERATGLSGRRAILFRFGAVVSLPVVVALVQGQVSLLLLLGVTALFLAMRTDRQILTGICLGVLLIKPQYVLAFLVLLIVRHSWKALGVFSATFVFSLLVTVPVIGVRAPFQYLKVVLSATGWDSGRAGFSPVYNRGFFGFAQMLLGRPWSTIVALLCAIVAIAILVRTAATLVDVDLPFALTVVTALLISPHVLVHDLSLLLLPVGIALGRRAPHGVAVCVFLYVTVLTGFVVALFIPVQLSVFGMVALAWSLIVAGQQRGTLLIRAPQTPQERFG